jgi:hypothetical protein
MLGYGIVISHNLGAAISQPLEAKELISAR